MRSMPKFVLDDEEFRVKTRHDSLIDGVVRQSFLCLDELDVPGAPVLWGKYQTKGNVLATMAEWKDSPNNQ